jgi:hypothetical protein
MMNDTLTAVDRGSQEFPMLSNRLSIRCLAVLALFVPVLVLTSSVRAERKDDGKKAIEEAEKNAQPQLDGVDPQRAKVIEEGKQNLDEIQRMLDEIQNDLSDKKTGAATQSQQKQVVKKMNQLIEKIAEECERCQKGGGSPKGQMANKPKDGEKKGQKPQGKERENEKKVASSRSEQQKQQEKRQRSEQEKDSPGKVDNKKVGEGKNPESELGRLASEIRRSGEKWGQLPPKVRDAIFSASTKPAPHEYRRIINRYYLRISEQYTNRK